MGVAGVCLTRTTGNGNGDTRVLGLDVLVGDTSTGLDLPFAVWSDDLALGDSDGRRGAQGDGADEEESVLHCIKCKIDR